MTQPGAVIRRAAAGSPPQMRTGWTVHLVTLVTLVALVPPLALTLTRVGTEWLGVALAALLASLVSQAVFAQLRRRPLSADSIVTALAIALVLPPSVPVWHVALAAGFGVIVGEQIFGGRGYNFLSPAVVALAFLVFSFPDTALVELDQAMGLAVVPGAVLLVVTGIVSWRVVIAAAAGFAAAAYAAGIDPAPALMAGSFVFVLIFFVSDPVCSASTNPGRWLHGLLFGALTVSFAGQSTSVMAPAVFAALLASIVAPLLDQAVIWAHGKWRRRRRG